MRLSLAFLALLLAAPAWADGSGAYQRQTNPSPAALAGEALFDEPWVAPPAADDPENLVGLGPTYNQISCVGCHVHNGKGHMPPDGGETIDGLLLRLSLPGVGPHGGPLPDPRYGDQLEDHALPGVPAEGTVHVTYQTILVTLPDGTRVNLRKPLFSITDLAFGPLRAGTMISPRVAQAVIGVGALGAIPEATIRAEATRQQASGGPVHGRVNEVWDIAAGRMALGRFGWKANQPSVTQQAAAAGNDDMGLTSPLFPAKNCPPVQQECQKMAQGDQGNGGYALTTTRLQQIAAYLADLQIPASRGAVPRGQALFSQIGCAACHKPDWPLPDSSVIHPYTDMLLHDMGDGLADGRPDYLAGPRDWRTAPLWGIGLAQAVSPASGFLHDGRARTLSEAVLWHGGEAQAARDRFAGLSAADRAALLNFLDHL